MPTSNVRVHVDFPTFNQLSEDKKSLINFFMENAALYFRGEYDGSTLLHMSGAVQLENTNKGVKNGNCADAYLSILYTDPNNPAYDPSLLPDHGASVDPDNLGLMRDGLQDVNSLLLHANTNLVLRSVDQFTDASHEYDYEYYYTPISYIVGSDGVDPSIPVVLSPMIGDTENTDRNLKPKNIAEKIENIDELYIEQIPIDKTGMDFSANYQLRTSSFTLKLYDVDDHETDIDLYYKIGLVSLDNGMDLDDIAAILKEEIFLFWEDDEVGKYKLTYDSSGFYIYRWPGSYVYMERRVGSFRNESFIKNTILPLIYDPNGPGGSYKGLMYIKLCNQDGTPYNFGNYIDYFHICLKATEDDTNPTLTSEAHLTITDQNVDGGFIPTPNY